MMNFLQGFNFSFPESFYFVYLDFFHNFVCCLTLVIFIFVISVIFFILFNFSFFKLDNLEYHSLEFWCTILPIFFLFVQMFPSLYMLYFFSSLETSSDMSLKVVGHQWYWSYSYSDFDGLDFDSYFKSLDSLEDGELRLLDVDNRCVLPVNTNICFCITSSDVIHSWTLFNMGFKLDAISGILSTFNYSFSMVGVYYGQCSEICGANHSFMPIVVEVTLFSLFKNWCLFS